MGIACRAGDEEPRPFDIEGVCVEACSCDAPCPCELTGVKMGCEGVAGVVEPGVWVRVYVDVKDPKQKDAAMAFVKAAFKAFGPLEESKEAKVEIDGKDGKYTVKVDEGKTISCEFHDGKHEFKLSGSNSYFNGHLKVSGKL